MNGPETLSAREAAERVRRGSLDAVGLVEACLARVEAIDGTLRAFVHVDAAGARAVARERAAEARAGRLRGPLHGVPVALKDIFDAVGLPTAAGAAVFAHRWPTADATSVARLRAAGAVVLGKTHTTQFAYRDPAPTRNPWNVAHTPGGSSSGSAAAVAARMVPLALGTQTVGSVIRPAAYCGVVGFKGSHGLVPIDGVVPLAWSLDHVGLFARDVGDVALALGVLVGRDLEPPEVRAPRLALAPELLERATEEVAAHVRACAAALERAGAHVEDVRLPPGLADVHAAGRAVLEAEAAAYHAPSFSTHAADYGQEIRKLIEAGLAAPATAYVAANRARAAFREAVMPLLHRHDALLSPSAPAPAPAGLAWTGDAWHCAPWSFAGVPAITLPSGLSASGLPLALQLVQAAGASARLLGAAFWCERVLGFDAAPPG